MNGLRSLLAATVLATSPLSAQQDSPEADPSELPRIDPTPVAEALGTFEVAPGFALELAAAEPQIMDPIAFDWDARGRLFAVEMRGYSERREDTMGRIRLLEDRDGDGTYETSRVFVDGLKWPTGVLCHQGGVFVIATPDLLYFKDTNGDGTADQREVIFTGFGEGQSRLNVQALANGLTWGLDGRVHGATAMNGAQLRRPDQPIEEALSLRGQDFSFDPKTYELRAESGGGQYGLTFDDWGNKFVCSNSHHMQWLAYAPWERTPRLPRALVDIPDDGAAAEVYRLSADEPWRLVRTRWRVAGDVPGPVEGGGRVSGYFTAATGICSYRGELFTADAGSNLVHRKALHWNSKVQPIASRPATEERRELVASRDNWFRPVFLKHGPDGCLYIADMYREVIEHPWSLPESLKKHLDLNAGHDRGRLYRLRPIDQPNQSAPTHDLSTLSPEGLVKRLSHPIAWQRMTAARLLRGQASESILDALSELSKTSALAESRLLALHLLASHRPLTETEVRHALDEENPWVRAAGLKMAFKARAETEPPSWAVTYLHRGLEDPSPKVRFAALLAPGDLDQDALAKALAKETDPWCQAALEDQVGPHAASILAKALNQGAKPNEALLDLAARQAPSAQVYERLQGGSKEAYRNTVVAAGHPIARIMPSAEARDALYDRHALQAANESAPPLSREHSLSMLAGLRDERAWAVMRGLLTSMRHEGLLRHTMKLLAAHDPKFVASSILQNNWERWSPEAQQEVIDLCLADLKSAESLLDDIEKGKIRRSHLNQGQIIRLQNDRRGAIGRRARALFVPKTKAEREKAVKQARPALDLAGNSEKGKIHYEQRCASCHEPDAENGKTLGPNRSALSQNGKERLLINLIDPNREVLPNYFASVIHRTDGTSVSGILLQENSQSVTVRQPLGVDAEIPRTAIQSIHTDQASAMPEALEAGLSHQDLADLLAFLKQE